MENAATTAAQQFTPRRVQLEDVEEMGGVYGSHIENARTDLNVLRLPHAWACTAPGPTSKYKQRRGLKKE